jgi:hypothetical protein
LRQKGHEKENSHRRQNTSALIKNTNSFMEKRRNICVGFARRREELKLCELYDFGNCRSSGSVQIEKSFSSFKLH